MKFKRANKTSLRRVCHALSCANERLLNRHLMLTAGEETPEQIRSKEEPIGYRLTSVGARCVRFKKTKNKTGVLHPAASGVGGQHGGTFLSFASTCQSLFLGSLS